VLLETGMAEARTALAAQQAFGVAIEHARYLTLHDLAAMMRCSTNMPASRPRGR
jgi:hypothetical protein